MTSSATLLTWTVRDIPARAGWLSRRGARLAASSNSMAEAPVPPLGGGRSAGGLLTRVRRRLRAMPPLSPETEIHLIRNFRPSGVRQPVTFLEQHHGI